MLSDEPTTGTLTPPPPPAPGPVPPFDVTIAPPLDDDGFPVLDPSEFGEEIPRRRFPWRSVSLLIACVLLSAATAYVTVELRTDDAPSAGVSFVPTVVADEGATNPSAFGDLHALLEQVTPAVVNITVAVGSGTDTIQFAAGSGVVISEDGLLLTNAHVVESDDPTIDSDELNFRVTMFDGSIHEATVLGSAPDYDVALMQIVGIDGLDPLPIGDPSTFQVGDAVVAIGNALDLGDRPTVTTGIISALERTLQVTGDLTLYGLIQTDAPINHGNSGGALINARGQLIGINSAGVPDAQNLGFAISVATIVPLLDDLKAGRTVEARPIAFIGIGITETPQGVVVTGTEEGTPAEDVGLEAGDVLVEVAGERITTAESLQTVLRATAPGTTVIVTVVRDDAELEFSVTLMARPEGT